LNKILQKAEIDGRVHSILCLQECSQLPVLEKKFKKARILLKMETNEKKKKKIQDKIKSYELFLNQIEKFERYQGKTIVIFETMAAKKFIMSYFKINPIKRYFYNNCCNFCKLGVRFKLQKKIPYSTSAPEPADFIYENAHYTISKRYTNELFVYTIGGAAIGGLFASIIALKVIADSAQNSAAVHYALGGFCTILNSIIGITGGRLVDNFFIRRRRSDYSLEHIILKIRLIFINTVVFFSVMMIVMENNSENFGQLIAGNASSLILVIPLTKLGMNIVDGISLKRRKNSIIKTNEISLYTQQDIINSLGKPRLRISLYVGSLANYIFISTSFYFVGGWEICAFGLIGLMINLVFDKYMMVKHISPINTKNSEMGLHFYEILRFEIPLQLLPLASLGPLLTGQVIQGVTQMLYIAFGLSIIYPRKSIVSLWKKAWTEKRLKVRYDDVKSQFPHTYEQEYLFEIY
jgi:hypothetical protein